MSVIKTKNSYLNPIQLYFQNELEDWNEENNQAGWDEIDDQNTKKLIRETKKEIRAAKHKHTVR